MKKRYTEEKEEALKLSDEIGVKKTSEQLGIQYYTISCWRRTRKAEKESLKPILTDDEIWKTDTPIASSGQNQRNTYRTSG